MKKLFYIIICMMVGIILPSCEKSTLTDDYPVMEDFYTESIKLPTVTKDSVKKFSCKVDGYVAKFPQAKQHKRYAQIVENIKAASFRIAISVDTAWNGEFTINF